MAKASDQCACSRDKGGDTHWRLRCKKHTNVAQVRAAMTPLYCPRNAKRNRVKELLHRFERGLLSYDRYSKAQLQTFINGRGLQALVPPSTSKEETVIRLEEADDAATFTRFLEMPPELRVGVYELHYQTFGTVQTPVQPPITEVSKLVREEALPLFYQHSRFLFEAYNVGALQGRYEKLKNLPLSLGYSCEMLRRLSNEHLSYITKLELACRDISWIVELPVATGSWNVSFEGFTSHTTSVHHQEPHENKRHLEKIAKEVAERVGPRKLLRQDVDYLLEVVVY